MIEQDWRLTGAPNARDLGGLIGADARRIRPGLLLRSGALGRLTDEDTRLIETFGVRCVVDLRYQGEIDAAPADRIPAGARVAHLPVHDPAHPLFGYVSAVLLGHEPAAYVGLAQQGTPGAMADIYRWFVSGEAARRQFGAAVRLAADADDLPLLFHCSAGKDRTGWLAVVLLTALGVEPAAIRADYLLTNERSAGVNEVILSAMRRRYPQLREESVRPLLEVRESYLDAGYEQVARSYGTFDAYLRDGLGCGDEVIASLRAKLLE
ncbi:tyrosine-protein phosphatase [Melissospora conviva]|uniref:tyrosine-protein phosphatase n=1 Tax=Melissospora conviva TaxID=3388432 RepID=UPI003B7E5B0E